MDKLEELLRKASQEAANEQPLLEDWQVVVQKLNGPKVRPGYWKIMGSLLLVIMCFGLGGIFYQKYLPAAEPMLESAFPLEGTRSQLSPVYATIEGLDERPVKSELGTTALKIPTSAGTRTDGAPSGEKTLESIQVTSAGDTKSIALTDPLRGAAGGEPRYFEVSKGSLLNQNTNKSAKLEHTPNTAGKELFGMEQLPVTTKMTTSREQLAAVAQLPKKAESIALVSSKSPENNGSYIPPTGTLVSAGILQLNATDGGVQEISKKSRWKWKRGQQQSGRWEIDLAGVRFSEDNFTSTGLLSTSSVPGSGFPGETYVINGESRVLYLREFVRREAKGGIGVGRLRVARQTSNGLRFSLGVVRTATIRGDRKAVENFASEQREDYLFGSTYQETFYLLTGGIGYTFFRSRRLRPYAELGIMRTFWGKTRQENVIFAPDNAGESLVSFSERRQSGLDPDFVTIPLAEIGLNYQLTRHLQLGVAIFPELSSNVEYPVRIGGQLRYNF